MGLPPEIQYVCGWRLCYIHASFYLEKKRSDNIMEAVLVISAIIAMALLVYLFYVLFRGEEL